MAKKRTFISFDYDHDDDLKLLLVGQAKNPDSPFELADWSIKEHLTGDWKAKARSRIRGMEVFIVICGEYTGTAAGVQAELLIAQEERIPYFFLKGRANRTVTMPAAAKPGDKLYNWTWDNLKALIGGAR